VVYGRYELPVGVSGNSSDVHISKFAFQAAFYFDYIKFGINSISNLPNM